MDFELAKTLQTSVFVGCLMDLRIFEMGVIAKYKDSLRCGSTPFSRDATGSLVGQAGKLSEK